MLATIVARHGSTPREVGSKMLVLPDGTTVGSVGGGIMEYRTQQARVQKCWRRGYATVSGSESSADGERQTMPRVAACGGSMDVFSAACWKEG